MVRDVHGNITHKSGGKTFITIGKLWGKTIYQESSSGDFYNLTGGKYTRLPQVAQDAIIAFRTGQVDRIGRLRFKKALPKRMPK